MAKLCKKCLNWMTEMKGKCLYWVTKMYRKCLCWLTKVFCYAVWTCHEKSDVTRYSGHHFSRLGCFWPTHDQTKALSYCMREGKTKCKYFMTLVPQSKLKADLIICQVHFTMGWLASLRPSYWHTWSPGIDWLGRDRSWADGSVGVKLFVWNTKHVCNVRRVWITCW